jgi:DNA-binding transcriptional MerR regulator
MHDFSIKKLYYSISEVSKITDVEQYVLRYWESEFEQLNPQKNRSGNRAYTNKDIQSIFVIKILLREKKYTIEGAKRILAENSLEELIETHLNKGKSDDGKAMPEEKKIEEIDIPISISKSELREFLSILQELYKIF